MLNYIRELTKAGHVMQQSGYNGKNFFLSLFFIGLSAVPLALFNYCSLPLFKGVGIVDHRFPGAVTLYHWLSQDWGFSGNLLYLCYFLPFLSATFLLLAIARYFARLPLAPIPIRKSRHDNKSINNTPLMIVLGLVGFFFFLNRLSFN